MRSRSRCLAGLLVLPFHLCVPGALAAQTTRTQTGPGFEIAVGGGILSGSGLDAGGAELRTRGTPLDLFTASSRIGSSVPIDVRLSIPIGARTAIEARGSWARPEIRTDVTGDFEAAQPITAAERIDLYSIDVGVLMAFKTIQPRALVPFVSGGAGYVGAVHEGLTLLENGVVFRGGGGFKYPLSIGRRGRVKGAGLRVDGALLVMTGGVVAGSGATAQTAASGSLYLTF